MRAKIEIVWHIQGEHVRKPEEIEAETPLAAVVAAYEHTFAVQEDSDAFPCALSVWAGEVLYTRLNLQNERRCNAGKIGVWAPNLTPS